MSLKAFHIVFITASILLSFGFAAWLIRAYTLSGNPSELLFGIVSVLTGVGLAVYGRYFLRKPKHIGYI
jgi:hypothetical protein